MTDAPHHANVPTRSDENPWEIKAVTVISVTALAVTTFGVGAWLTSGCPLNLVTMGIAFAVMPLGVLCLLGCWLFSFLASRAYRTSLSGHLWATTLATFLVIVECAAFIIRHYIT